MNEDTIKIRLMKAEDFDDIVKIDERVLKIVRPEYYKAKFERFIQSKDYVPTSLVAEGADGKVVGFIMGELYIGQYGISEDRATLDTIGVDPAYQTKGLGKRLINEFMEHLKSLGIKKVNTLVDWDDSTLLRFFSANMFSPSKVINLSRII